MTSIYAIRNSHGLSMLWGKRGRSLGRKGGSGLCICSEGTVWSEGSGVLLYLPICNNFLVVISYRVEE